MQVVFGMFRLTTYHSINKEHATPAHHNTSRDHQSHHTTITHLQYGRREPIALFTLARQHVPHGDGVVRAGADQAPAVPRPADRAHRVHVRRDDLGDAARQEVPDDDAAVVAADGQQGALAVERAGDGARDAVERAVKLLRVVLAERFEEFEVHGGAAGGVAWMSQLRRW